MLDSAPLFASLGDAWEEAIVLCLLGWLDVGRGDFTRGDLFERAYLLARQVDDEVATAHAATDLAELHLARGSVNEAREMLDVAFTAHEAVRLYDGLSYGLEAAAGLASRLDRAEEAARLLGAADGLRDEVAVPIWSAPSYLLSRPRECGANPRLGRRALRGEMGRGPRTRLRLGPRAGAPHAFAPLRWALSLRAQRFESAWLHLLAQPSRS